MIISSDFSQIELEAVQQLARQARVYVPDGQESLILLAKEGEMVQGFAVWQRVLDEASLLAIAVADAVRRQGVARQLLASGEKALAGISVCFLEVRSGNSAAQALYRHAGFVASGRRRGYYSDGEDALLMRKESV